MAAIMLNSEMSVMRACGISEWSHHGVMLVVAVVMAIINGLLTLMGCAF